MSSEYVLFEVHWTTQLTKKHKVWDSGFVRWNRGNSQVSLLNEVHSRSLADGFIAGGPIIGREYTIGGHLVEVLSPFESSAHIASSSSTASFAPSHRISTPYTSPPAAKRRLLRATTEESPAAANSANPAPSARPSASTSTTLVKNRPLTRLPFRPPTRTETKATSPAIEEPEEPVDIERPASSLRSFPELPSLPSLTVSALPPSAPICVATSTQNYVMMDWNFFETPLERVQAPATISPAPASFGAEERCETSARFGSSTLVPENSANGKANETPSDEVLWDQTLMSQEVAPSRVKTFSTSGSAMNLVDIVPIKAPPLLPPRLPNAVLSSERKEAKRALSPASPFSSSVSSSSSPTSSSTRPSNIFMGASPTTHVNVTPARVAKVASSSPLSSPSAATFAPPSIGAFKTPTLISSHAPILGFGAKMLNFPSRQTLSTLPKIPRRSVSISSSFSNISDYKQQFSEALFEDMNHGILAVATKFRDTFAKHSAKQQDHEPLSDASKRTITSSFKQVYFDCDLISHAVHTSKKRKWDSRGDDYASNSLSSPTSLPTFYLKLPPSSQSQEPNSAFQKDDLYLISSTPDFEPTNPRDFIFFARSTLHGRSSSVMEIKPMHEGAFGTKAHVSLPKLDGEVSAHAIHVMSVCSDMSMLDALLELSTDSMPLLPFIMNRNAQFSRRPVLNGSLPSSTIQSALKACLESTKLNVDQLEVFKQAALWFDRSHQRNSTTSPFVLVHGVFGSGKSHMLVLLIRFLCELFDKIEASNDGEGRRKLRILVSAATNTAVDRILVGLLDLGFTDFVRVGSLKRINSRILPFSVHREKRSGGGGRNEDDFELSSSRSTSSNGSDSVADRLALRDLDELLKSRALSSVEKALIEQQKREIESGSFERKLGLVESATVVGATCIASTFPILKTSQFDIVILDECSQIPEPLSLLPTSKFGSSAFILVGDPLQLPPQLRSKSKSDELETEGLGSAMFSRLTQLGYNSSLLRTQYRLHPSLSAIPNELFYSGRLIDGVSRESRQQLHPSLPTLLFVDNEESRERVSFGGSIENAVEGSIITTLLQQLVSTCSIEGDKIGVICLYKAQVSLIQDLITRASHRPDLDHLKDELAAIQVSTVDAFQGAEKDVIMLSTCRTESPNGYGNSGASGFLESPFRINVSLSRARRHLIIVGSAPVLLSSSKWKPVLNAAKSCGPKSYISGQSVLHGCYFSSPE